MKKALLYIGGASVFGYAIYRYFKKQAELLSSYEYKIAGINIKTMTLNEVSADVIIRFTSKADFEAKINKIYLDLFLDGVNVGYVTQEQAFIIPARGSSDIPLFISINPQVVLKNITNIVLGVANSKDINFSLNGYANIKSGFISTTLPIKYETTLKEYLKGVPTIK